AKRELDPAVAAILREEAAHEAEVRAREAAPPEDTARAPQTPPTSGARERLARLQAAEKAAAGPKLTPDTEALVEDPGASLRDPQPPVLTELPPPAPPGTGRRDRGRRDLPVPLSKTEIIEAEKRRRRVGFRLGFGLTAGLCCAALALYLLAPHLAAALPQGTPLADLVVEHGNRVQAQLVEVLDRWLTRGAAS
ncbi:MAG: hypothetical protein KDA50_01375, partial [Rhodobacteraceae bacterium]|nr:hypothetical protein [Paracoccaceae bacterium]